MSFKYEGKRDWKKNALKYDELNNLKPISQSYEVFLPCMSWKECISL